MLDYNELIKITDWNMIMHSYDVYSIADVVPFREAITLAYRMLYNKSWDEEIQNYAVELLYAIRKKYTEQWNACWKLDVLLGMACNITLRYDERYLAYKSACDKISPAPPSLLVLLANCYDSPGDPPISRKEAKDLLLEALNIEKTIEGVELMKYICDLEKKWDEVEYWNKILKEVEQKDLHIDGLCPSFLIGIL